MGDEVIASEAPTAGTPVEALFTFFALVAIAEIGDKGVFAVFALLILLGLDLGLSLDR